jgi:ATP-dependent Clp protease ATP-binding subunit ClpA
MFERFTTPAREVVVSAQQERDGLGQRYVGTEHLLLGLLNEGGGIAYEVLTRAGLARPRVREDVRRLVSGAPLGEADAEALRAIGIDLDEVRAKVEQTFGAGTLKPQYEPRRGFLRKPDAGGRFSPRAKKVLELALREAIRLHDRAIGPEHILLGLLREGDGLAAKILADRGIAADDIRDELLSQLHPA